MFDQIKAFSPALHLGGMKLKRITAADMKALSAADTAALAARTAKYAAMGTASRTIRQVFDYLLDTAGFAMPLGVFFLSFMQWWYAREVDRPQSVLPIPPPPMAAKAVPTGVSLPDRAEVCPVCRNATSNPTALAASGYVFCYPCIYRYIEQNNRCPVTWVPATTEMLVSLHTGA
jgi:hypothetical protein